MSIPLPIQVVIDDVGWWRGEDGHERQQPYRTGIARNHVPEDYEAIVQLGKALGIRPQAALVLCEWDRENTLRELPSATWMGAAWDNAPCVGPWLDQAADVLRRDSRHVEIALHGIGHEFWVNGRMERAEWHDRQGRMRPREEVLRHLDFYQRLLDQHQLGPFPESFVPAAFLHRFGDGDHGLAGILRGAGVRFISTPFKSMHVSSRPQHEHFGVDGEIMTVDRGTDLFRWFEIAPTPQTALSGPICGMHWPQLLHPDPARNHEVVDRWIAYLRPHNECLETMLAPDTRAFQTQLYYREFAELRMEANANQITITKPATPLPLGVERVFTVNVLARSPVQFNANGARLLSASLCPRKDVLLYHVRIEASLATAGATLTATPGSADTSAGKDAGAPISPV